MLVKVGDVVPSSFRIVQDQVFEPGHLLGRKLPLDDRLAQFLELVPTPIHICCPCETALSDTVVERLANPAQRAIDGRGGPTQFLT